MEEENGKQNPAEELLAGKFKSVDALVRAYGELEAEFTRRSQRLKALEEEGRREEAHPVMDGEALYLAAANDEQVRSRILGDYIASLKGVPLLGGAGAGLAAPVNTPKSIKEAGALALSYINKQNK